jgi:hypothetical protein
MRHCICYSYNYNIFFDILKYLSHYFTIKLTAVNREMTERIVEPGQQGTSDPEKAREIARRSGMAKGTAGADESDSE